MIEKGPTHDFKEAKRLLPHIMPERVDPEIAEMLMSEEEIMLVASQSKVAPGGTLYAPNKVYITNVRLLFRDPTWFGLRSNIIDISYSNISTIMLKRGIFTTEIHVKPKFSSQKMRLPAVDKRIAMQVSMLIKKGMKGELLKDQLDLEAESKKQDDGNMDKLERLMLMRRDGILTEEELQIMKQELLLSIKPEASLRSAIERKTDAPTSQDSVWSEQYAQQSTDNPKDLYFCRYCNFSNLPAGSNFCSKCGQRITEESHTGKTCQLCNAWTRDDSIFCTTCDKKFSRQ